ncbi:MAG TPA: AraC family transcriptional regulator [Pyrinomonadaceae bacterium]|nr:AraC family transcriptional regulator [Pyrinomonadaceae bacterium]
MTAKREVKVEPDDGGLVVRRRTELLSDGTYLFEDTLAIDGPLSATVITCEAWLVELYELKSGDLAFLSGNESIAASTHKLGVLYPPFTITQPRFTNVQGHLVGIAATGSLLEEFKSTPILFDLAIAKAPPSVVEILEILRRGINRRAVPLNPRPSLLALRTKRLIDETYRAHPVIARIAQRLGVTHEHLSRQFKCDFRLSPSAYLHKLRVADAPLRLARGEEIVNVSQEVGYNDLSRFYKHFRNVTDSSPGACKKILRPRH